MIMQCPVHATSISSPHIVASLKEIRAKHAFTYEYGFLSLISFWVSDWMTSESYVNGYSARPENTLTWILEIDGWFSHLLSVVAYEDNFAVLDREP